ncbi:MAG: hypothetical protein JW724_07950 [Candidatus Altiarchaeota archaeon]|nr:hypothetical protein [Candidatus Altiarchaeota archaeon]
MKDITKSVKISINPSKPTRDLENLLETVFWKEPDLAKPAGEFLDYLKEWSMTDAPHKAGDWKKYCMRSNLSQSQYHTILRRLRRAGMIEKTYRKNLRQHEITPSGRFGSAMYSMSRTWDAFLNK